MHWVIIRAVAGTDIAGYSGDGGIDTAAEVYLPEGVATDICGNLYICDLNNNRIRKVTFADTATISLFGPTSGMPARSVSVSATIGSGGAYTIHWYNNGILVATTTTPSYTYTMSSTADTITATLVSVGGCYDSVTSAAHIVTANNDAVPRTSLQFLNIYPNPAHNSIIIEGAIQQAELSNTIGQSLIMERSNSYKTVMDISVLPAGVYFITVTGTDNSRSTSKIIKQ